MLQFSLQDNGSAKYFQGAMHTSNMGEKVAQVSHDFRKEIPMGFLSRSSAGRIEFTKAVKSGRDYRKVGRKSDGANLYANLVSSLSWNFGSRSMGRIFSVNTSPFDFYNKRYRGEFFRGKRKF